MRDHRLCQHPGDGAARTPLVPAPKVVEAARRHLASRFASGRDRLRRETYGIPMADAEAEAIGAVIAAAAAGGSPTTVDSVDIEGRDLAAALVLVQAAQLDLDRIEAELLDAARDSGVIWEAVAAIIDFPCAQAALNRHRRLMARRPGNQTAGW
jgi:hypothetical protein